MASRGSMTVSDGVRGEFTRLSKGLTRYALSGPSDGHVVVFVHGIAGPMDSFDRVATSLAADGCRTLQYDLFGRGFSERPAVEYALPLFVQQLEELLTNLAIRDPITLVGWSLGGMICASFASLHPGSVDRLAYIAPAGIDVHLPLAGRLAMIPLLGEALIAIAGRRAVLDSVRNGVVNDKIRDGLVDMMSGQMTYPGYFRAYLSTLRNCGHLDVLDQYATSGRDTPVLLITGSGDPYVGTETRQRLARVIAHIQVEVVEGAGHFPHVERPEAVLALLSEFCAA